MTRGPMRRFSAPPTPSLQRLPCRSTSTLAGRPPKTQLSNSISYQKRRLAQVRPEPLHELWFTSSAPRRTPADEILGTEGPGQASDHRPPDERRLALGKTLRILSPTLPNILTTPLPQEILSPSITLHLFPSTHPHLPTVKGRVPYRAALWTAPVAWGCVPIVGNVKLRILSEKIVRSGSGAVSVTNPPRADENDPADEKLVVRWITEKKSNGSTTESAAKSTSLENGGINRGLSTLLGGDKPIFNLNKSDDFSGLFVFTFDEQGRVASHTIEHADESNSWEKMSRVVTLTDWLLGKAKWNRNGGGAREELVPGLAMRACRDRVGVGEGCKEGMSMRHGLN